MPSNRQILHGSRVKGCIKRLTDDRKHHVRLESNACVVHEDVLVI